MGVAPPSELLARGPWDAEQVEVHWSEQEFMPEPAATKGADAALAELHERGSPTHDGLSARLAAYRAEPGRLTLELEPARWSLRLAGERAEGISALCAVRDCEGRWLAGRRADWVASWPGRWALGAGGAVDVGENPVQTLARELSEEWSVVPERLTVEALVRLSSGLMILIGMARLARGAEVEMDPEHDAFAWWPADIAAWPAEADEPLRHMAAMLAR